MIFKLIVKVIPLLNDLDFSLVCFAFMVRRPLRLFNAKSIFVHTNGSILNSTV